MIIARFLKGALKLEIHTYLLLLMQLLLSVAKAKA